MSATMGSTKQMAAPISDDLSQALKHAPDSSSNREHGAKKPTAVLQISPRMTVAVAGSEGSRDVGARDSDLDSELSSLGSAAIEALLNDEESGDSSTSKEVTTKLEVDYPQKVCAASFLPFPISPNPSKLDTLVDESSLTGVRHVPQYYFCPTAETKDSMSANTSSAIVPEKSNSEEYIWPVPDPDHLRVTYEWFLVPKVPIPEQHRVFCRDYLEKLAREAEADSYLNIELDGETISAAQRSTNGGTDDPSSPPVTHAQLLRNSALSNLDLMVTHYPITALWCFKLLLLIFPAASFIDMGYTKYGRPMLDQRTPAWKNPQDLCLARGFITEMRQLVKDDIAVANECLQRIEEKYPTLAELTGLVMRQRVSG